MFGIAKQKLYSSRADNQLSLLGTYITTSEFAKVVNVTRYTIINWVNQERIRSVKTAGGHRRIPLAELIIFLEAHSLRVSSKQEAKEFCWQQAQKQKKTDKCATCVLYGNVSHYCALLVTHLGREKINCNGECSSCDYWHAPAESINICNFKSSHSETPHVDSHDYPAVKNNFVSKIGLNIGNMLRSMFKSVASKQPAPQNTSNSD